jgi:hypothetical protein
MICRPEENPVNRLFCVRLLAVVVATLTVGQAQSVFADHPVPFRGWAKVTVTGAEIVPPNTQKLSGSGTGIATHLGQFTRTETLVLDLTNFTFTGKVVFTAANGNQLFADFVGGFSTPATAAGVYTFTGGTGRFQNATGTAAFAATAIQGGFAVTFNGTINY